MAIETINLPTLKRLKNNVIGNPLAKLTLAQDEQFVQGWASSSCTYRADTDGMFKSGRMFE